MKRSCGGNVPDVLGSDKLASETVPGTRGKGVRKAEHRETLEWIVAFIEREMGAPVSFPEERS